MKFVDREASIASGMEKEVLSKHRKALMLFGTFHLMHGIDDSAASAYEKDYPHLTFVISDLRIYDTNRSRIHQPLRIVAQSLNRPNEKYLAGCLVAQ